MQSHSRKATRLLPNFVKYAEAQLGSVCYIAPARRSRYLYNKSRKKQLLNVMLNIGLAACCMIRLDHEDILLMHTLSFICN